MKKTIHILFALICTVCAAQGQPSANWQPGKVLDAKELKAGDINRLFTAEPISDEVFARMWKKSYKENCTVPRNELRYLHVLHANKDGKPQTGELVCNKAIADDLLDIFRKLYDAGYRIEKILLVDEYNADDEASMADNNTSCFNFRKIAGINTLSRHSRGMAIDISPLTNPCLYPKTGKVSPKAGEPYAHNRRNKQGQKLRYINKSDLCYKLFMQHGFIWGGSWSSPKDYQHFEKR